jgi:hypothetical protein
LLSNSPVSGTVALNSASAAGAACNGMRFSLNSVPLSGHSLDLATVSPRISAEARVVLGGALVLGALALAIVFNDELFDAGVVAFGAAYFLVMLGGPVLAAAVAGASDSYASRVLPSVEFLPDSGKSQWDRGSSRASFPGRLRDRRARAASSNRAAPV